jgi:ketosteroid isomerase-like protein
MKHLITLILLLIVGAGTAIAQKSSRPYLDEARAAIEKSNNIYFQAFARNDSSIFIDRYAEDCWIMPANAQALCGTAAPLDFFRTAYHDIGLRNGKFITIDVFGDGKEYVTEIGFWESYDADNKLFDHGKYLVLWKKTPAGWKMFRDSFSSDKNK